MKYRFKSGKLAILRNMDGGRLFLIHSARIDGVVERIGIPSQQKYADKEVYSYSQLVAMPDDETAIQVYEEIAKIADERRQAARLANSIAEEKFEKILKPHRGD